MIHRIPGRLALAALAVAALPGLALAQSATGTRIPSDVTVVEPAIITGAIVDEKAGPQGEDPADTAIPEAPVVYEDAEPAAEPVAVAAAEPKPQ